MKFKTKGGDAFGSRDLKNAFWLIAQVQCKIQRPFLIPKIVSVMVVDAAETKPYNLFSLKKEKKFIMRRSLRIIQTGKNSKAIKSASINSNVLNRR